MHRVTERLKLADERSKSPKAVQAFAEITEEPQERTEDLGKGSQLALRNMKRRMEEMTKYKTLQISKWRKQKEQ